MIPSSLLRWLRSHRVAVLKGGWSSERSISLKTGHAVEESFKRLKVKAVGIDVTPSIADELIHRKIKFCFLALHGPFGEDGRLQGLLDVMKIPYTGCGVMASALAMDKHQSKKAFVSDGVLTAPWVTLFRGEATDRVKPLFRKGPLFVKPVDQGSAIGVSRVDSIRMLPAALRLCFKSSTGALVEQLIEGRELTVGILGTTALPVVEIIPQHRFYDFHSKYAAGGSRHLTPAPLTVSQTNAAQQVALAAFRSLGCSVYGRVDIMMDKQGRMNVLEVNTIPGMTSTSLLPDAARAAGYSFDDLVLKIIGLSLHGTKN